MLINTRLVKSPVLAAFKKNNLRIGILHAGGPAPGGNLVLYGAALRAKDYGVPLVAFKNGYSGPMNESVRDIEDSLSIPITREQIRYLRDQNALVPGSSRANPGKQIQSASDMDDPAKTAALKKVLDVFEALRIGAWISVGGDDTMGTGNKLQMHLASLASYENLMGVVHVPKTIDKDYPGIPFTFGFMSAAEFIGDQVKGLHDDAKAAGEASKPVYHIVEIMGRKAGWLTAAASIYGQATYTFVPEDFAGRDAVDLSEIANDCVNVVLKRKEQGKNYGVITLAEGIGELLPKDGVEIDDHGHTRLDQVKFADRLLSAIKEEMERRGLGQIKLHSHKAGYNARQVKPNFYDVMLCQKLGLSAVDAIFNGNFGHMVSVEGVFDSKLVSFSDLVDPETLKVNSWVMDPECGMYQLLRGMQQPF
ncbi:MAG: 6-phosphofructokinase [Candidatus Saganbacteria bacterium]|nr:6-phosphofructokinase [Candidatus Saganbacteria bacterium]